MDEAETTEENLRDPNYHLRKVRMELAAEIRDLGEYLEDLVRDRERHQASLNFTVTKIKEVEQQMVAQAAALAAIPREVAK